MTDEISASVIIDQNLTQFALSMIKAAHPNAVDGLKPVLRRIVDAVRDTNGVIKSAKLIALTNENHPHGEDSIYHAAARLGQSHEYNPLPLIFDSACGTYADPRPAASKYTNERLSEFSRDVFFEGIEYRALPKEQNEGLNGYEPIHLIPAIPTALLYANSSIGYGMSSYTVPHNLADVCDLVVDFCKHMKHSPLEPFDYVKHVEKFLPDFPSICTLTNHRELLAAYKQGKFTQKIKMDGEVVLLSDAIHINTLPYGTPFKGLDIVIEDLMKEKNSWFDKNIMWVKDLTGKNSAGIANPLIGNICIKLKRGVNVFEAWELISKKISFSGSVSPIPNYNDGGYVIQVSQPNLLRIWYDARYNILVSSKKLKIGTLTTQLRQVEALMVVCDNLDAVVALLRVNTEENSIRLLQDQYNLTLFQSNYVVNTRLRILTTTSRTEQEKRKFDLEKSLRELLDSFGRISDEMATEAQVIKKRYPTPRRTKIPAYIGYIRIGGGCIQFDSLDEIPAIIESFPKETLEIYIYDGPFQCRVSETGKLETGYIPKITTGDIYGIKIDLDATPKSDKVITVNILDGVACCVKGFIPGLRKEGYFYTTPISKAIRRNGTIDTIEVVKEISLRKTICRGSMTDIIYTYPEPKCVHYVLALNSNTPNVIAIQRVSPEKAKIAINPTGSVLLVHSLDKHFFLNIPPEYLNRSSVRVAEFLDLESLLGTSDHARIDIATAEVKKNRYIRLL